MADLDHEGTIQLLAGSDTESAAFNVSDQGRAVVDKEVATVGSSSTVYAAADVDCSIENIDTMVLRVVGMHRYAMQ